MEYAKMVSTDIITIGVNDETPLFDASCEIKLEKTFTGSFTSPKKTREKSGQKNGKTPRGERDKNRCRSQ